MERMSGADALMLYLDRARAYNHTIKMAIFDPPTDEDGWSWPRFKRLCASRVTLVPRLRQRYLSVPFGLNHPVWVDDPDFNLDCHLKRVACPAPGTMVELSEVVASLYAQRLDHTRPLWQMWVIEGLEGGRICVLILVHHALTDGVGILRMMHAFWNTGPEAVVYVEAKPWNPPPLPSRLHLLLTGLRDLPGVLRDNLPGTIRGMRAGRRLRKENRRAGKAAPPGPGTPDHDAPFVRSLSSRRSFAAHSLSLARFKLIGKALGATVNDVFLACVAGTLRHYLTVQNGSPPARPMIGSVPFSLLPLSKRTRDGNYSTLDFTVLHSQIEDPLARLRECRKSALLMKENFEATRDANLGALLSLLPPFVLKLTDRLNEMKGGGLLPFFNVGLSNVPGPSVRLHLGALHLSEWYSIGQISHGMALNVTGWSYVDQFNVCMLTDTEVIAEPWVIMNAFSACVDELEGIATAQAGSGPPATPIDREQVIR